jgi:hypothetical protein
MSAGCGIESIVFSGADKLLFFNDFAGLKIRRNSPSIQERRMLHLPHRT